MTVLVLLCSGCQVLWVNVWLGLVGIKISGFLQDSTGLIHSLLPCLEGILPALKYTFTMRVRKRVCVVGPCSHKIQDQLNRTSSSALYMELEGCSVIRSCCIAWVATGFSWETCPRLTLLFFFSLLASAVVLLNFLCESSLLFQPSFQALFSSLYSRVCILHSVAREFSAELREFALHQ